MPHRPIRWSWALNWFNWSEGIRVFCRWGWWYWMYSIPRTVPSCAYLLHPTLHSYSFSFPFPSSLLLHPFSSFLPNPPQFLSPMVHLSSPLPSRFSCLHTVDPQSGRRLLWSRTEQNRTLYSCTTTPVSNILHIRSFRWSLILESWCSCSCISVPVFCSTNPLPPITITMTFREKVRRVFHRSSASQDTGRPKVEYYRRHEVPPSKFRGPFDKEHQKRLAAWSFDRATVERTRSLDLSLSPCATFDLPGPIDSDDSGDISPDDDGVEIVDQGMFHLKHLPSFPHRHLLGISPIPAVLLFWLLFFPSLSWPVPDAISAVSDQDILNSRPTNPNGSQSSTVVNSDSYNGSMMTLLNETSVYDFPEDPISQLKESVRYCSPIVRTLSPVSRTPRKGMHQPFAPEDLTRALIAVQVCA